MQLYTGVKGIYTIAQNINLSNNVEFFINNIVKLNENVPLLQNGNQLVIPQNGTYFIMGSFEFRASNVGYRQATVYKNGSIIMSRDQKSITSVTNIYILLPVFVDLMAGDVITFSVKWVGGAGGRLLKAGTNMVIYYLGR